MSNATTTYIPKKRPNPRYWHGSAASYDKALAAWEKLQATKG